MAAEGEACIAVIGVTSAPIVQPVAPSSTAALRIEASWSGRGTRDLVVVTPSGAAIDARNADAQSVRTSGDGAQGEWLEWPNAPTPGRYLVCVVSDRAVSAEVRVMRGTQSGVRTVSLTRAAPGPCTETHPGLAATFELQAPAPAVVAPTRPDASTTHASFSSDPRNRDEELFLQEYIRHGRRHQWDTVCDLPCDGSTVDDGERLGVSHDGRHAVPLDHVQLRAGAHYHVRFVDRSSQRSAGVWLLALAMPGAAGLGLAGIWTEESLGFGPSIAGWALCGLSLIIGAVLAFLGDSAELVEAGSASARLTADGVAITF
jgi:hypothetical protein